MLIQNWEHFFKPEVRASGQTLVAQGKVSLTQTSDLDVAVYIRTSPPLKVQLKVKSHSDSTLYSDCNCPVGKKNQLCKHIWASLLALEKKNPDFFESLTQIEKTESSFTPKEKPQTQRSKQWEEKQAQIKEQQKAYRKDQYQKQKEKIKKLKNNKKETPKETQLPPDVEKALTFFSLNGFELRENLNKDHLGKAKKNLARIFHPDLGGSHEEIVELNKFNDILMKFAKK